MLSFIKRVWWVLKASFKRDEEQIINLLHSLCAELDRMTELGLAELRRLDDEINSLATKVEASGKVASKLKDALEKI